MKKNFKKNILKLEDIYISKFAKQYFEYTNKFYNKNQCISAQEIDFFYNKKIEEELIKLLEEIKIEISDDRFSSIKRFIIQKQLITAFSWVFRSISEYEPIITNSYYNKLKLINSILNYPIKESDVFSLKRLIREDNNPFDSKLHINTLISLLNEAKGIVKPDVFKNIEIAINAGEWELGFELLCRHLWIYCIPITEDYYHKIINFNSASGNPKSAVSNLKKLTKINELIDIVNNYKSKLSKNDLTDIFEYIHSNDWKSAFELLCIAISETNNIVISQEQYIQIVEYAKLVNIHESEIIFLKRLIR